MQTTVFLIDDDEAGLNSLGARLEKAGVSVQVFRSGEEFLRHLPERVPGCVVAEMRLPGLSGLELLARLNHSGSLLPVIFVAARVDVTHAVKAMELGAVTLMQKPYDESELIAVINRSLHQNAQRHSHAEMIAELHGRLGTLTEDEKAVLYLVVDGKPNKVIASTLKVSMRTVDRRRSSLFEKMNVQSAPELARLMTLLEQAGIPGVGGGSTE